MQCSIEFDGRAVDRDGVQMAAAAWPWHCPKHTGAGGQAGRRAGGQAGRRAWLWDRAECCRCLACFEAAGGWELCALFSSRF